MKSTTLPAFREKFARLPNNIQKQTQKAYRQWIKDRHHPGLQFKRIHKTKPIYSVRISRSYRAIGLRKKDRVVWFWIGTHEEYNNLAGRL
jgi:hypothetical protein